MRQIVALVILHHWPEAYTKNYKILSLPLSLSLSLSLVAVPSMLGFTVMFYVTLRPAQWDPRFAFIALGVDSRRERALVEVLGAHILNPKP